MSELKALKADYLAGRLPKAEYIERMHALHAKLYEYAEFIRDTSVSAIEINDGEVRMTMRESGLQVIVDAADHRLAPIDALNFGTYEEAEMRMMVRLIDEGDTIFDIGANIGWYSLMLAKQFQKIHIHAFEPIPTTFAFLKRNIELNRLSKIETHPFGFSDRSGDLEFYFYPEGSVNASLADVSGRQTARKITCRVLRLDDFVTEKRAKPDFIKCDVEGAELLVFQGGERVIAEQKPIVFTEMLRKWSAKFNYHPNQIIELFLKMGYGCFTIQQERLVPFAKMDDATMETNFFFLHRVKHEKKIRELCPN